MLEGGWTSEMELWALNGVKIHRNATVSYDITLSTQAESHLKWDMDVQLSGVANHMERKKQPAIPHILQLPVRADRSEHHLRVRALRREQR